MSGSDRKAKDPRAAGEAKIDAIKREAARDNEVASLLDVASDILENRRTTMIDSRHAVDIRNAALRAAFMAADEDSAITQAHLEAAAQLEYEGMGKITVRAA